MPDPGRHGSGALTLEGRWRTCGSRVKAQQDPGAGGGQGLPCGRSWWRCWTWGRQTWT
ncbi:MAG: hypothetical protein ACLUNZ_00890 [Evtepia sp.]